MSEGEAKVVLNEQHLVLLPQLGEPIVFSYANIDEISEKDYKIDLITASKEKLTLERLGYQYEDFLFQLFKLRNELLLKYLLMEETLLQDQFYGQFLRKNVNQSGNCEIRLYDTALVVLPQKAEPIRIPYCYISQINKGDYRLTITNEFGEEFIFSMLGEKFDPLIKALSDAQSRMMTRTQESIQEIIPEASGVTLSRIASLMKDGKAVPKKYIDQLSPNFWSCLTKRIMEVNLSAQYGFLSSLTPKDQIYVGLKRGLMGNLTGQYTWLLFPLKTAESNRLSNTIAFEAVITQEGMHQPTALVEEMEEQTQQDDPEEHTPASAGATYFFRIMGRKEYAQTEDEKLTEQMANFVKNINRCMIEINFRREPIFLSETQLENPKYAHYRYAVAKIPALKTLRSLFIGKVIHTSPKQWINNVNDLLTFNNKSLDNNEKWKKGEL